MSEPTPQPAPAPQPAQSPVPLHARSTWKYTILLIVLLAGGATGYYFYERSQNPLPPPVDEIKALREYATRLAGTQKLAPEYTDADGDLVADPPKDAAKFLALGDELVFSTVGTDDAEEAAKQWKDLMASLEKATGKKVKYAGDLQSVEDQLAAVRAGKLHVTAFNTGAVPTAVTAAGFVPLFAPADKDGKYSYEMEILVRADSPIVDPKGLAKKKVGFVALSSNSGAKAPLVLLSEKFELNPGRDYEFGFTGEHERSVRELIAGRYDAVCVANDLIRRAETRPPDKNPLDASKYKAIYKSEAFPPLCFGVPHHLPADVAAKVKAALAAFKFEGTSAARFAAQGKVGFAPVNYKKDWEFVRKIDDTLTRLFDRN